MVPASSRTKSAPSVGSVLLFPARGDTLSSLALFPGHAQYQGCLGNAGSAWHRVSRGAVRRWVNKLAALMAPIHLRSHVLAAKCLAGKITTAG